MPSLWDDALLAYCSDARLLWTLFHQARQGWRPRVPLFPVPSPPVWVSCLPAPTLQFRLRSHRCTAASWTVHVLPLLCLAIWWLELCLLSCVLAADPRLCRSRQPAWPGLFYLLLTRVLSIFPLLEFSRQPPLEKQPAPGFPAHQSF